MHKTLLLLLLLLAVTALRPALAQNNAAQTYRQQLQQASSDTAKIRLLRMLIFEEKDSAITFQWIGQAMTLARRQPDAFEQMKVMTSTGYWYFNHRHFTRAIETAESIIRFAKTRQREAKLGDAYKLLHLVYFNQQDYKRALEAAYQSIRYWEAEGRTKSLGELYEGVALCFMQQSDQREYAMTERYLRLTIDNYTRFGNARLSAAYTNLGNIFLNKRQYDSALVYYRHGLALASTRNDVYRLISPLCNVGVAHYYLGRADSSLHYLGQSRSLHYTVELLPTRANLFYHLGNTYAMLKRFTASATSFDSCLYYANVLHLPDERMRAYEGRFRMYRSSGDTAQSFAALDSFLLLKDSLYRVENTAKLNQLQVAFESEKKDLLIARQSENLRLNRRIFWLSGAALLLLLVIALLLWRRRRMQQTNARQRLQLIQAEYEKLRLEHQLQVQEKQQLNHQLEQRNKELVVASLSMQQKNELLGELGTGLYKLSEQLGGDAEQAVKTLRRSIRNNLNFDQDWEKVKLHFENVHHGFFEKLLQAAPDLTQYELKHCAYIRMGLTTKEIGSLMGIDPKSVRMSRYRIKKKLQLGEEQELVAWVNTL
jgi:DNA-binding CsgD family transcriptional regulator